MPAIVEIMAQGSHIRPPGIGKVFYVQGFTGLNTNNGIDPGTPFLTITYALTQCVSLRNDYIIVLNGWAEATPIVVNKQRVHILGLATDEIPAVALTATGDTAVFVISGSDGGLCEIAGFDLGGGNTHAGIEPVFGGPTADTVYIHDCGFGSEYCGDTAQNGIWLPVGCGAKAWKIVKCKFQGSGLGGLGTLTASGIRIDEGAHHEVRDCLFSGVVAPALAATGQAHIIRNNDFALPASAAGSAVTIGAGSANCFISNNKAAFGEIIGAHANPYLDNAGLDANHWVGNLHHILMVAPG